MKQKVLVFQIVNVDGDVLYEKRGVTPDFLTASIQLLKEGQTSINVFIDEIEVPNNAN